VSEPGVVSAVAAVLFEELDEHGYEDDDEKRGQVAHHFAAAVVGALGLTEERTVHYPRSPIESDTEHVRWVSPWVAVAQGADQ